jgi:hypothetical protein
MDGVDLRFALKQQVPDLLSETVKGRVGGSAPLRNVGTYRDVVRIERY